jgi:general secretion pathway protein N
VTLADHRRLTPWLLTWVVLQLGLLAAQLSGQKTSPDWLPPLAPDEAVAVKAGPVPPKLPLEAYANTWEHPLFNRQREPDASLVGESASGSMQGLRLTGSVITDSLRIALLRDANGKSLSLAQGKALPNGWTLQRVEATQAIFVSGEQQQRLRLLKELPAAVSPEQP